MADPQRRTGRSVLEKTREQTQEPELYNVFLLNDDYTTMEFVVQVLESIFNKGPAEAFRIMMLVHTQGQGLCGVFPWDIVIAILGVSVRRAPVAAPVTAGRPGGRRCGIGRERTLPCSASRWKCSST